MTDPHVSFSELNGQNESVHMLDRKANTLARGRGSRTRTRCTSSFNNGTTFFIICTAVISLLGTIWDAASDWWVSIQSATSGRTTLLFGDVYVNESEYGLVMLLLMLVSGVRLSFERFQHLQPVVRVLAAILLAPFIHFASVIDNVNIIFKVVGIKKNRRQVEDDYGLKIEKDNVSDEKQMRAKWECIPLLFLTTLKIGLTSKISVMELLSVTSSSLCVGGAILSSLDALRKNAGLRELSLPVGSALQMLVSIPIFSTFVTCATFAFEAERDAIFVTASDASPALLLFLLLFPILLLFLTLVSVPHFTFIFFPFRLQPLKFFSEPPTPSSTVSRLLLVTFLFAADLCFGVYFIRRDNFPLHPERLFNDCAHFDVSDCGSGVGSGLDPCDPGALCGLSGGKFELRVALGRKLWTRFNLALVCLLGVAYLASMILVAFFSDQVFEMVRSLYCDTVMTEAHRALDGIEGVAKTAGEWTLPLREKLLDVEAEIVQREKKEKENATNDDSLSAASSSYSSYQSSSTDISEPAELEANDKDVKRHLLRLSDIVGQTNSLLLTCDLSPDEDLARQLKDAANAVAVASTAAVSAVSNSATSTTPSSSRLRRPRQQQRQQRGGKRLLLFSSLFLLLLFLLGCVFLTAFLTKSCPDDLNHFLPIKGRCFHFDANASYTQAEAKGICEKMGAELVEIDGGKEELTAIEGYLTHSRGNTAHFWIGLIKRPLSKFWHWDLADERHDFVWASSLKTPTFDVPWFAKEPGHEGFRNCVLANLIVTSPRRLFLYNWGCNIVAGFACEAAVRGRSRTSTLARHAVEKSGCDDPDFRDIINEDSCYHFEQSPGCGVDWDGAVDMCAANNSTLAVFETKEEWESVKDKLLSLGGGTAWIGGRTETINGGDFQWVDKTQVAMNASSKYGWWANQPGPKGHGDCIKTGIERDTKEFGWQTFRCAVKYAFICEKPRRKTT